MLRCHQPRSQPLAKPTVPPLSIDRGTRCPSQIDTPCLPCLCLSLSRPPADLHPLYTSGRCRSWPLRRSWRCRRRPARCRPSRRWSLAPRSGSPRPSRARPAPGLPATAAKRPRYKALRHHFRPHPIVFPRGPRRPAHALAPCSAWWRRGWTADRCLRSDVMTEFTSAGAAAVRGGGRVPGDFLFPARSARKNLVCLL